ncbi:M48 family metallopeptidase [Bacterioplanoides sp.]|uniref:M48 family metallopeptidase n=1 Tax=Bacterioplanoides sp. TaxID=2066072 RepID=UPI003B00825A
MDTRPSGNPILPDHINNKNEHPLKDFLILSLAVVLLISLFTWLLAASASWLAPKIPYEWELSWKGDSHLTTEGSTEPHEQQEQALQQLLQKLTGDNALPVQVHYLADEETPNAFATLGGHIFITRGLLENIRSENGLAMVLAHEYAHIQLRHPMTLLLEQLSLGVLWALMGSDNMAQTVTQSTSLLTLLAFSRDMERDADQFALQRLSATYGHTAGADEFFTQIHQLEQESSLPQDSEWLEFVQTHPITDERIQTIRGSMQAGTTTALPTLLNIQ